MGLSNLNLFSVQNQIVSFQNDHFFRQICLLCNSVEKMVDGARPPSAIWSMRFSCWIPKATNTHFRDNVILIAFPLQQWLYERSSILSYTWIAYLVKKLCALLGQGLLDIPHHCLFHTSLSVVYAY